VKKYIGLIIWFLPFITSAQLVMTNNYYVVLNGGNSTNPTTLVLTNSGPSAITRTGTGWIVSENEFNVVQWNIGTSTGTFVVPFGYSTVQYLPVTLNISTGGTGSGNIKFSTYHSTALNSGNKPSDVNNLTPFILPGNPSNSDDSYNIADRFYVIDANTGYSVKPTLGNITFSYISGTANSEVASPNILTESRLMAQRFNSTTKTWTDWFAEGCTDAIVGNVGTVQTGTVTPANFYRSWSLWDNTMTLPLQVTGSTLSCYGDNNGTASVTVYGGVSPYAYSWATAGGTSSSASGLTAGTYTVTVTDNHSCSASIPATITQPSAPISVKHDSVADGGSCNGIAAVTASGGTPPYTYLWATGGQISDTIKGQCSGTYCCTITDNNNCTYNTCVTIKLFTGINNVNSPSAINIYPDPNTGHFNIDGLIKGQIVEIYDYIGQRICTKIADETKMNCDISDRANGIYLVRIQNSDGNIYTLRKIVKTQ
jgi:hypothetical protein